MTCQYTTKPTFIIYTPPPVPRCTPLLKVPYCVNSYTSLSLSEMKRVIENIENGFLKNYKMVLGT